MEIELINVLRFYRYISLIFDTLAKTLRTQREMREMFENEIGSSVIDCAIKIHRETGPGLLESVYERILAQ